MPDRRALTFANFDEGMPEVERLLAGHSTVGRWTLGQILYHLATAIRLMTEGSSASPGRTMPEAIRRRFFRAGRFPEGVEAPLAELLPPPDRDARAEAEALRTAIGQFASATGPFANHPLLGPLTKDEWARFHCIHCAHHLSFALPDGRTP